jgi:hypothetical protein
MAVEGDLQTLLGALVSGRCYPVTAPDSPTKPYITYQVISNVPLVNLDGPEGLENRRVQIDIWGDSYGAVKTLEVSVKSAMAGASFTNVPLPSPGEGYESDTKLYGVTMDYSVWST